MKNAQNNKSSCLWYLLKGDRIQGPVDYQDILDLHENGQLKLNDQVSVAGESQWYRLEEVISQVNEASESNEDLNLHMEILENPENYEPVEVIKARMIVESPKINNVFIYLMAVMPFYSFIFWLPERWCLERRGFKRELYSLPDWYIGLSLASMMVFGLPLSFLFCSLYIRARYKMFMQSLLPFYISCIWLVLSVLLMIVAVFLLI